MSIYFEYEVGERGRSFRRAVDCDKYDIEKNLDISHTKALFGDVNIGSLIELSVLSICMINEAKRVVGFLALSDHPNVNGLDPSDWEHWLRNLYDRYYISRNTLFIHFICCIDSVKEFFLEEALISVFHNDSYLSHIVLVVPVLCLEELITKHAVFKKRKFHKILQRETEAIGGNYLITAMRQDICPKLKVRRAVEEDNDDVVDLLDKTCPRLKELYGMYYISELIGRHPESQRKILVGDVQGRAVSVICINTEINYMKLQDLYELKPFYGLNAVTPLEREQHKRANTLFTLFGDPIIRGKCHPFDIMSQDPLYGNSSDCKKSETKKYSKTTQSANTSKINFRKKTKLRQSLDHIIVKDSEDFSDKEYNITSSTAASAFSVIDILDDDSFDYDIVNIDKDWLTNKHSCKLRSGSICLQLPTDITRTEAFLKNKPNKLKIQKKNNAIPNKKACRTCPGAGNAFMIELFALREDIDERHSFDMLEAAFELMKEYDYCIIRIPSSERSLLLLQHFCFVPTRPRVCSDKALYITHRSSVLGKLRVRQAELIDIPEMANLLHPLDAKDTLSAVQNIIVNNKENQAYVLTSGTSVVGLGILELPKDLDFIRGRFNLDSYQIHKYRYEGNGVEAGFSFMKLIITYPVFEVHYRFFARELMRLSGSNTLMYTTAYRNKWNIQKGNSLIAAMVPLVPRPFEIGCDAPEDIKRLGVSSNAVIPFNAWFIGKKITSIPKLNVTTRIVIVGASRTSMGFLHSLLFGHASTYLTFTNVTLISPNGLPYKRRANEIAESMFQRYYNTSDKYLKSIPYTYYLNVIQGKMAEINLEEKFVILNNGKRYEYDLLFLFFGKQYQHPNYMSHLLKREEAYRDGAMPTYTPLDVPRLSDTEICITSDVTPDNVFIINNIIEANNALQYVKGHLRQNNFKIIVYGARIHAYLCINALLKMKVPAPNIIFIEPFPSENANKTRVSGFCNSKVDDTMMEVLDNLKITVYRSYYFQSWTVNSDNNITQAEFISYTNYIKLECSALFYYGTRGIDMSAYVAIHKSGLSYDGGVIIDQECQTRDPAVYAAGPNTRYHRRYYADSYEHKYYDSYEVGTKLGARIRNQLDPLFTETKLVSSKQNEEPESSIEEISFNTDIKKLNFLQLNKPKVTYCTLPGGFKYLEVRSPGRKSPHHYLQSLECNGYVMETYKKGYFKIHLSKNLYVDGITCLSTANFSLERFKYLYGHSTATLKNIHLRFSTNKLDDFFEFFRAPWAFFLYHDQTEDLFTMSKELFPKVQNRCTEQTIKEALCKILKDQGNANIHDEFKKSPYVEAIIDYVVEWLSHNDILLPMYMQPSQIAEFTYDINNILMFRKK